MNKKQQNIYEKIKKLIVDDYTRQEIDMFIGCIEAYKIVNQTEKYIDNEKELTTQKLLEFLSKESINGISIKEMDNRSKGIHPQNDLLYNPDTGEEYYYDKEEHISLILEYIEKGLINDKDDREMFIYYLEKGLLETTN